MWSQFVLCLFVGLAFASTSPAWKDGTEYVYQVNGRTLSSLEQAADQYSGILLKAKLLISSLSNGKLQGRIFEPQYAKIQSHLPSGWDSEIPESQLSYKELPLSQKPFQMVLQNGLFQKLIVEKDLTNWEANIIKSILSQFQLDLKGQNAIRSPMNNLPRGDQMEGVFKTMEETVTGETETLYDVHRLPEYLLQTQPWLAPQEQLRGDGYVIEVVKSKNFTNAEERPSYHYGFGKIRESEPTANKMGQFFIRESTSRAILTGKPFRYAIQSSCTVNRIMVNPILKDQEKGSVVSMVNVTLIQVRNQDPKPDDLSNPIEIGNLVYTYEKPFSQNNRVYEKLMSVKKQDLSSEESAEDVWKRIRRSSQLIRKQQEDSSSEETNQYQPEPQMSRAPEFPLLPTMMGYHGKSLKANSDFDVKQQVEKLAQEMSQEIKEPEKILSESTLNKYTMLNTLVRMMSEEEIKSVAEQLYTQEKEGQRYLAWIIYTDSVAEAGTGPAFLNIQQLIQSKKIEGSRAAEMVATMASCVRVPTEEYMRKYFEMIKHPQVKHQKDLNETAVLSYTALVYKVYINKNESHNQYPVHAFGSFYTKEGRKFVKSTVIPYLSQQLQEAISNGEATKIHVYIRALGNVGHKRILQAFEPYLEGQKKASQFQRSLMVVALDKLALSNPTVARSVLYKIYQNSAEIPELRILAVYQLMRTNPPVEMLQRMAQNTNVDAQEQVNAVVKSMIETASELRSSEKQEMRKAAQAARPLLTRKHYGGEQSFYDLRDYFIREMDCETHHHFLEIGSQESNWPMHLGISVDQHTHGIPYEKFTLAGMISSIRELTTVLKRQTQKYQDEMSQRAQQQASDAQWSSAKIARAMNYAREEREQLEGIIYAQLDKFQRMWSFDNQTVDQLPEAIRKREEMWRDGHQVSYTKFRQLKEVALSFPTEMGLPFLYTYDRPLLINWQGKMKAVATPSISKGDKLQMPDQIHAEIDGEFILSCKDQSHLSFVTPFDHQIYMAGYDRNAQMHVPVKVKVQFDVKEKEAKFEFEVEEPHQEARLLHFSSYPYTSRSDIMTIRPVALRPNTYVVHPQKDHHRYFDIKMGQKHTGLAFRVWGHHNEQSINLGKLTEIWNSEHGILGMFDRLWDQISLQHTSVNVALIQSQTTTRKVILRGKLDKEYKSKPERENQEEFLTLSQMASKLQSEEPKQRLEELKKHVGSGIHSSLLWSSDISLTFEGDKKHEYVAGIVSAKSNADPKSCAVIYCHNKQQQKQFALEIKGEVPNTNGLDLTEALETEPRAKYAMRLQYGESDEMAAKISGKIDMTRSSERKQYLVNREPLYHVCKQQMQQGNFQLPACQNMTIRANFLDDIKMELKSERLNRRFEEVIEGVFKGLRVYYYPMTEIDTIQPESEGVVSARIQFQPENFRQVNVTVRAQDEQTRMCNISLPNEFYKTLLVPHPVFHMPSRMIAFVKGWENIRPTCVIDQTAAQTFLNRTYPLGQEQQYTVVLQYVPQYAHMHGDEQKTVEQQLKDETENYVVLMRQVSEQKELLMTLNHPKSHGKTVQIELKPSKGQSGSSPKATVTIDGQKIQFNDKEAFDMHKGLVQIYSLPNGEVKLEIEDAFYLIFDGKRVKVTATSDKLRDSIYGLCGRFSQDKYEDFTVPANCIVKDSKKFVESYQVHNDQQRRQQRSGEWPQACVPKVLPLYADVISERDSDRYESQGQRTEGTKLRHRYVEENGEICFTIRPLPECHGEPQGTVSKNVPVHCIQATKTAYYFKSQIDQGGNPDFSHKSETKTVRMEVPLQCN